MAFCMFLWETERENWVGKRENKYEKIMKDREESEEVI